MHDQLACGKGLAEHSALPAKLAELTESMAKVLEMHQDSLDLSDEYARNEQRAYAKLTKEFSDIANQLHSTAEHMAGYRDLPMARHDVQALVSPKAFEAFAAFVNAERELLDMLQTPHLRDEKMLNEMRGAAKA